jgi:beta-aspartyl-dipeptidase (metallo-type)
MADTNSIFKLIHNGTVYTPEPLGPTDVLLVKDKIVGIGPVDQKALLALDSECEIIDATGCIVTPGLIDPHEHIIGAGGEHGFDSRMPEITLEQIALSGITTLVGLLGTDTTTRHLACLHAKAKQLSSEGITAYLYTGGFEVPPSTFLTRITDDLVMINEVIGTGEIAISDYRWVDPPLFELARVVTETMLGGMMSGKAGVTHFHVGEGRKQLSMLKALMDEYDIPAKCIYPTHITRTPELLDDAIALTKRGSFVDMDIVEENLADCLNLYRERGGLMERLTVSSDAHTPGGSPEKLYGQFVDCVREHRLPIELVLPCFTRNPAEVLKLTSKGRLEQDVDADVLVLEGNSLDIRHVFAGGKQLVRDGQVVQKSKQMQQVEESRLS